MQPITVFDSIMGSGKTSYIIDYMHKAHTEDLFTSTLSEASRSTRRKFIYVTPLLDEVDRVQSSLPMMDFKDPVPVHGRKYYHLEQLLERGENIATTHELFKKLTQKAYRSISAQNYTLVIDEVLTCCDVFSDLRPADQDLLFENRMVYVEEGTSRLRWNHDDFGSYQGKFDEIRNLCDNGNLCVYGDSQQSRKVILWQFPSEFLQCFDNVLILTYLFEGSPMRAYLAAEGIVFDLMAVKGDRETGFYPVDWYAQSEADVKERIKSLVTVYEGKLNQIGDRKARAHPFSKGWFNRQTPEGMRSIKAKAETFFKLAAKTPSAQNAWTTFSDHRMKLKGRGYSNGSCWIPLNTKATNQYSHKTSMAYLANRFSLPIIKRFFEDQQIDVSEDVYAISEMIQVLWRTAIRNGEPVHFYIPSERMRHLFKTWLQSDNTFQLLRRLEQQENRLREAA